MSPAKLRYWQDKAAQLDPAAYVLRSKPTNGAGFTEVVPAGECWYIASAFFCMISGCTSPSILRNPDIDRLTMIGSGTKLEFHPASPGAMHYTCRPALVVATDIRYQTDPKGLYYERLYRLRCIPSCVIKNDVPAGAPYGASGPDTTFPDDFTIAMCLSYSNHNTAWGGLAGSGSAINLGSEISDDHQNRIGEKCMFPFSRLVFDKLRCRGGSVSGAVGVPYIEGNVQITYAKLPSDW